MANVSRFPGIDVAANRRDAIRLGIRYYFGRICAYGHEGGVRYTADGKCKYCNSWGDIGQARAHRKKNLLNRKSGLFGETVAATRAEAKLKGNKFYLGAPCVNGHEGVRYTAHCSCVECLRLQRHRFADQHPNAARRYAKAHRRRHPEAYRASIHKWRQANLEEWKALVRHHGRLRRARQKGASGNHTVGQLNDLMDAQNGHCAYCEASQNLTLDHKLPLSRNGSHDIDNLQWLCAHHNSAKKDRTDEEYRVILREREGK